jgi:hypothetical protein
MRGQHYFQDVFFERDDGLAEKCGGEVEWEHGFQVSYFVRVFNHTVIFHRRHGAADKNASAASACKSAWPYLYMPPIMRCGINSCR